MDKEGTKDATQRKRSQIVARAKLPSTHAWLDLAGDSETFQSAISQSVVMSASFAALLLSAVRYE